MNRSGYKVLTVIVLLLLIVGGYCFVFFGHRCERMPYAENSISGMSIEVVDSLAGTLHSGDVVFRMGRGVQSKMLAQINRHDHKFSHCGIVIVENGHPFVYHAIGGEDNPDARLRRDSAEVFFSPRFGSAVGVAVYGELNKAAIESLVDTVLATYRSRPHFDTHFDLKTDDELYCTEFVCKMLVGVSRDTSFIPLSSVSGRRFVGTDNLYLNSHAQLIWWVKF